MGRLNLFPPLVPPDSPVRHVAGVSKSSIRGADRAGLLALPVPAHNPATRPHHHPAHCTRQQLPPKRFFLRPAIQANLQTLLWLPDSRLRRRPPPLPRLLSPRPSRALLNQPSLQRQQRRSPGPNSRLLSRLRQSLQSLRPLPSTPQSLPQAPLQLQHRRWGRGKGALPGWP